MNVHARKGQGGEPANGHLVTGGSRDAAATINDGLSQWIDLFRMLAAFGVMLTHAGNRFVQPIADVPRGHRELIGYIYAFLMGFSHQGIMIFFVVSGFLVGGTAWREVERTGGIRLGRFASRRLVRLWIVMIPAILATLAFDSYGASLGGVSQSIYAEARSHGAGAAVCNLAFLQTVACNPYGTDGAFWTLYNEFSYYLLCVFGLVLIRGRNVKPIAKALLSIAIVAICVASVWQREETPMLPFFSIWLLGMLAATTRKPLLQAPSWLLLGVLVALLIGYRIGTGMSLWDSGGIAGFVFDILTMGVFAAFLAGLRFHRWDLPRPVARGAVALASFTFTLYCFHVPLMNLMAAIMQKHLGIGWRDVSHGTDWLRLAVQLGFVVLFAFAVSRLTEMRTDQIRRLIFREGNR